MRTRARAHEGSPCRSVRFVGRRSVGPCRPTAGGAGRGGRGRPGFPFVALIAFLFAVGNVALLSLVVVPLFSVSPTTASTPLLLAGYSHPTSDCPAQVVKTSCHHRAPAHLQAIVVFVAASSRHAHGHGHHHAHGENDAPSPEPSEPAVPLAESGNGSLVPLAESGTGSLTPDVCSSLAPTGSPAERFATLCSALGAAAAAAPALSDAQQCSSDACVSAH